MKLKNIILIITFFSVSQLFFSGCDSINNLPLNVPISFNFEIAGAGNLTTTHEFCLNQSSSYTENVESTKKLTLLRIIYRTDASDNSVLPESLEGDFEVIIRRSDTNQILINTTVSSFKPVDYRKPNAPYELELSDTERAAINEYLNSNIGGTACFEGTVILNNFVGAGYLKGHIDVLIEAEIEL
ncbi:MAG: hypothetical protein R6W68_04780 [Ignavibacteriaceae bacterium]